MPGSEPGDATMGCMTRRKSTPESLAQDLGSAALAGATAAAAGLVVSGAASVVAATYFARKVVQPDALKADDSEVISIDAASGRITLARNDIATRPGFYGLWQGGRETHARVGPIVGAAAGAEDTTVVRELLGVDCGELTPGPARLCSYFYGGAPDTALGLDYHDVIVESPVGQLPAWQIDPPGGPGEKWAILVHGRGAWREECLRAVPVLHKLGWTCLVPAYRNDADAPTSPDRLYALGLAEWQDVSAAMDLAEERGATEFALFGWSMGGAIVLQTLARDPRVRQVSHVVLDAPVVDWGDVLQHSARINRVPAYAERLARLLMGSRWGRSLIGLESPLDVPATNWVHRAAELDHQILVIHSVDDDVVPFSASNGLAIARPDLVRLEVWDVARHCREWNVDRERWERVVGDYLSS